MKRPVQGDLIVTEDPDIEHAEIQFPVLENEEGELLLGGDLESCEQPFVPFPFTFTISDGILLGFDEGLAVRDIVDGGAPAETLELYHQFTDLVNAALEHEPSDDEYDAVAEFSSDEVDLITALTLYGNAVGDGTALAAALFEAAGIPLPGRDKLILVGMALDNLDLSYMDGEIEDEEEEPAPDEGCDAEDETVD